MRILTPLIVAFLLSGCGPKISSSISLPIVSVTEELSDVGKGAMVFVEEVTDSRENKSIGRGPDGPISPIGSVSDTVRETVESHLRKMGFSVTDSAPTVLQVEVRKWQADYINGVPGKLVSEASIAVKVLDPGNKLAYSGSYSGSSSVESTGIDDRIVKDTLASSLSEAIRRLSRDKQLFKFLSAY